MKGVVFRFIRQCSFKAIGSHIPHKHGRVPLYIVAIAPELQLNLRGISFINWQQFKYWRIIYIVYIVK
jgi:hypothetical protein